jgi:cytochrome c553
MKMTKKLIAVSVLLSTSMAVVAAGDAAAGKTKSATCAACHGADGNSPIPNFPKLAGQGENYLVKQINEFKEGKTRNDPTMAPMVAPLTPQDIEDLAAFFHSQKQTIGEADKSLAEAGKKLYLGGDAERGISACIACHGPQGMGMDQAKYPRISGQHAAYTEIQLKNFKAGKRSNDPGSMMRDIAAKMSEADMKAVASYIQGLH